MIDSRVSTKDEKFLQLALNLARRHVGLTGKNPSVGCVITCGNIILGRGTTQLGGRPHAEVISLNKLSKKNKKNSTIYVSLEPCSHYGKTPPCVNKIINSKLKRVVYSINDLDPRTSGKSLNILKSSKIKVKKDNNKIGIIIGIEKYQNLNNIDAPYSCKGGACASCVAKLKSGEVQLEQNYILTDSEIEEGLIITCQAYPVSEEIYVDVDDI